MDKIFNESNVELAPIFQAYTINKVNRPIFKDEFLICILLGVLSLEFFKTNQGMETKFY